MTDNLGRPDYKRLSLLRTDYPRVPTMALTATATPRVRTDILHQLQLGSPKWFLSSFNRTNLRYMVKQKKAKSVVQDIASLIQTNCRDPGSGRFQSGIVYCLSKHECEDTAEKLEQAVRGLVVRPYHAGLALPDRCRTQEDWVQVYYICHE